MNSFILSSIAAFCHSFANAFRKSGLCKLLMKIYNGISGSWKNSSVMTWIRNIGQNESNSVAVRIVRCPFTFLTFIKKKIGKFVESNIKNSFICHWARVYIQNFMAVNTRFLGIMILATVVCYSIVGMHLSKIALIVGVIGAIIYDEKYTNGKLRLVLALLCGIIVGAVMSVSKLYGLAIPFALFGMVLVMHAPITGVYAAVFLAPFMPTMILAGICLWTALSLVIKSLSDENFKWKFDGVGMCILLLLGVLLVSSLASFARMGSLKVWAMYLVFLTFYFVVVNTVKTKEQLYGLFKIFVISGALVALYGVMQYAFGWTTSNAWIDEEMFEDATMRVYSTLGNPNVLGEYLLLVLPVAAVYMLKNKWKELSKWAYGLMFLVLALCLVLTQSRGCWIGFMLSVVIFVTFDEGKWWGFIPIVLCILPFIIPQTIVDRIMSVGNMEDSSTSYRVYIWMGTLGMMKHYWLGGIGMGEAAFSQVYPFFSYNAIIAPHSHNLFLQLLVEAGISGLGVFLVMQIVFVKKMSDVYRMDDKKSTDSMLALALGSGVIGFLAQSMFDYTFYNYRVMAVFFMVLAMGMMLLHLKQEDRRTTI